MNEKIDFIVVGQGLAGTLMAAQLIAAGQKILVIDDSHRSSSSLVAAGIINPITGKRIVKSWLIDELLKSAFVTYKNLEIALNCELLEPKNIIRTLTDAADENEWISRSVREELAYFVEKNANLDGWEAVVKPEFAYSEILGARVDLSALITKYREILDRKNLLLEEKFDFDSLVIHSNSISYKNIIAEKIIFCEGQLVRFNPFFNYLPFEVSKGEIFEIKIPNFESNKIYKKNNILINQQKNSNYWVGAGNYWDFQNDMPSELGYTDLVNLLDEILGVPYEIAHHKAAIRPSTKTRRPFLGKHPKYDNLLIFNGLGAKGTALAPYFSAHLCNFIFDKKPLMQEVDIAKYDAIFWENLDKEKSA